MQNLIIDRITGVVVDRTMVSKNSIVSNPAIEPDPAAVEYINQVICRAEGNWFGKLFDRLFNAMPSPHAEDYRSLSVDQARHGIS